MKILVVTYKDSDNLMIENVLREFEKRGHELTIFACFQDENSLRMFRDLNADIRPVSELNAKVVDSFDIAFCGAMTMEYAKFLDIYCFSYSQYYEETFMTEGADFLFTYRDNCMPRCDYHCGQMPVGMPKNDRMTISCAADSKRILFVDSGHMPFGRRGKEQIADMLLHICHELPDYELCIKPRWLRDTDISYTHRNTDHLYTVIEERCGGVLPSNLTMLTEHLNLQELIDSSVSVITLYSGAHLDVILRNKGLLIASGWENEDKWDIRNDVHIRIQRELYAESGCEVDYTEITKYLPYGIHANKAYEEKMFPYKSGASERIVDVVEHVYENFLSKGVYPQAKKYAYETYQGVMKEDPVLSIDRLKSERIRNILQQKIALFSYKIKADIDFSKYYEMLDRTYLYCPLTVDNYKAYSSFFDMLRNDILIEQSDLLDKDPIDQSFLLRALYYTGQQRKIVSMPWKKVLCPGPFYYFLGLIYSGTDTSEAIKYFAKFVEEADTRSYNKYFQEEDYVISKAYNYIFNKYDGENLPVKRIAELCINYYEHRNVNAASFSSRKRIHSLLPEIANEMAESDQLIALKCLQIYAKYEQHYNIRQLKNQIKRLKKDISKGNDAQTALEKKNAKQKKTIKKLKSSTAFRITTQLKSSRKIICGGIRCVHDNGIKYTIKLLERKCVAANENWKKRSGAKEREHILELFRGRVLEGYKIYESLIKAYGDNVRVFYTNTGTGDAYISGKFFDAYVNQRFPDCTPVFYTFGNSGGMAAGLYGIERIATGSLQEIRYLCNLLMFDTTQVTRLICLHYQIAYQHTGILFQVEGIHDLNYFSADVEYLGLSASRFKEPVFDYDHLFLERTLKKYNLIKGKTVLLAPYTKSVKLLPTSFWQRLALELMKRGFCVCTNSSGENEPSIMGTVALSVPYVNLVPFLEMIGAYVGIRSGFTDVASSAKCVKITLYPMDTYKRGNICHPSDFLSLEAMYNQADQHDLVYSSERENELLMQIVQYVTDALGNAESDQF